MTNRNWVRIALVALLTILAVGSIASLSGSFANQLSHSKIAFAYSSGDPIATGSWQRDQYDSIIVADSQNQGLNPFIVKGQIMLESDFNTYAVSQVINAGCGWTHDEGLMQVNAFCQGIGSANLFDPSINIYYGTLELGSYMRQLGSIDLALQAYNIGLPQVLNGQRNWAYSSQAEAYAQQFTNEHCALYGCGGGSDQSRSTTTATTSTRTTASSAASTASAVGSDCVSLANIGAFYTVKQGDTLGCISQKTGLSINAIANLNNMGPPYVIYPGEVLSLSSNHSVDSQAAPSQSMPTDPYHLIGDPRLSISQFYYSGIGSAIPLSISEGNASSSNPSPQESTTSPYAHGTASRVTTSTTGNDSATSNGTTIIVLAPLLGILTLASFSVLLLLLYWNRGYIAEFFRKLGQALFDR